MAEAGIQPLPLLCNVLIVQAGWLQVGSYKTQAQKNQEAINEGFKEPVKTRAELNQERIDSETEWYKKLDAGEKIAELTCEICGKVCKSKLGLGSHMRSHKDKA
jgi:hypothetical protein